MAAFFPTPQSTPAPAPSIASCLGKIAENICGENPNSNDICENLDFLSDVVQGFTSTFRFIISDSEDGVVSNASFSLIANEIESNAMVIANYSGHQFYLSSFSNASSSKSCVFNGIVAGNTNAIVHTFNITPDGVTHTATQLVTQQAK